MSKGGKKDEKLFVKGRHGIKAKDVDGDKLVFIVKILQGQVEFSCSYIYNEKATVCNIIISIPGFSSLKDNTLSFKGIAKVNTDVGDVYDRKLGEKIAFAKAYEKMTLKLDCLLSDANSTMSLIVGRLGSTIRDFVQKNILDKPVVASKTQSEQKHLFSEFD
jgi:hypothetical protein